MILQGYHGVDEKRVRDLCEVLGASRRYRIVMTKDLVFSIKLLLLTICTRPDEAFVAALEIRIVCPHTRDQDILTAG